METSIPSVLGKLAQSGVSVQWRDGRAVFKAPAPPAAEIVALIDARKAEISAFLHPEAVQRRLDAEAMVFQTKQPPDATDVQWDVAMRGLRTFLAAGHGAEAERLGWPKDELYAVPKLWSQIHLCGAALLIGDREVVSITADEIRIRTASGATLAFRRRPQPDYAVAYRQRCKELAHLGHDEARFRAFDHCIALCRQLSGCDLEEAKALVRGAIAKASTQ
jgi:hypothetical protein